MKFSEKARQQVVPYWEGSFTHPFITELQAGTLDPAIFRFYLIQDAYYLQHFTHLYTLIAAQTQEPELKAYALQSAEGLAQGEITIRHDFFAELNISTTELAATTIAPTTYHYVSHNWLKARRMWRLRGCCHVHGCIRRWHSSCSNENHPCRFISAGLTLIAVRTMLTISERRLR